MKSTAILRIGLGLTFLALALVGLLNPDDIKETIEKSQLFSKTLEILPFFVTLVAVNDLVVGMLLIVGLWPKIVSAWASFWLITVIVVLLSQVDRDAAIDALEHSAFLAIGVYLFLSAKGKNKVPTVAPN